MLRSWVGWQTAITNGKVRNINMFQSLWSSVKGDACEERFLEKKKKKRQKGDLDRMTHCWFKVTDLCLDKVVQTRAKYRTKRKIRT